MPRLGEEFGLGSFPLHPPVFLIMYIESNPRQFWIENQSPPPFEYLPLTLNHTEDQLCQTLINYSLLICPPVSALVIDSLR